MRNRESALCIRLWSQPLVTGREGVSPDKLHIGVSGIANSKGKEHNATRMSKICETIESVNQEMIWTVDLSSSRSFGDWDL
jgi:hypothetical protein